MRSTAVAACAFALAACGAANATDLTRDLTVEGDALIDANGITAIGARGETLGIHLSRQSTGAIRTTVPGVTVRSYAVERFPVTRPSTALYGGSRGAGTYPDGLVADDAPATSDAYIEIAIPRDAAAATLRGEIAIGKTRIPLLLTIASVALPDAAPRVWAYEDPREFAPDPAAPSTKERACVSEFRRHGVLLAPDVPLAWWSQRADMFRGVRDVPVSISSDPMEAASEVREWIARLDGTGHVPFAIPIDEPRTAQRRTELVALARAVRGAGGGPNTFRLAVTDTPHAEYDNLIDQYISLDPTPSSRAWRYNGAPPSAGSMVLDAVAPGPRTWGWIAHRDDVGLWYVWDALYWHDRHNRHGAPLPGKALDLERDTTSFDDGDDHGNLDGVLALPSPDGCRPTLRLAALGRGQQDRALLDLASACHPAATAAVVASVMPRGGAWPTDAATWERARRSLLKLASCSQTAAR
ncbi:MAG TPA: hypothetical protein VGM39_12120 [Kofleriaceae bacterium]|jgi:hypothetical protein